jgi:cathepsin B
MNSKVICVFFALIAVSWGRFSSSTPLPRLAINKDIINTVNSDTRSTWTAGVNEKFIGQSIDDARALLGWIPNPANKLPTKVSTVSDSIPTTFSSITKWGQNCPTIATIYNQAECGSCWAFGAVESISDRFCIASKGKINYILSFQDLVSCDDNDDGCEGGDADSAFNYVQTSGLVTGTCYPYGIPTCPPQDQPCLNFVNTPDCANQCNDSEIWSQSLHYLSNAYDISSDVSSIQTEIMTNGPVEVCFTVYEDFLSYKTGVYQYTTGQALGGHCVKMIGWGVEKGVPYWLCNNSWTTYWGDNGQFKILRGADECGIEDDVVAGTPQL